MDTAAAIVIGSGAFGASTAYHLARRGAQVTLVDQHALGSQTSPRAAGLTSKADATPVLAQLRHEACDAHLRNGLENARALGIEAGVISAEEAHRLAPHFEPGAARAIGYVPSDCWLEPSKVAIGFALRAGSLGARLRPFTGVQKLLHADGKITGVGTAAGEIRAPIVVDAAGAWTGRVAAAAGITIPL